MSFIEQQKLGLAIQWGAIGEVGMVIENLGSNDVVISGTLPQRISSCLDTIDIFLQQSTRYSIVTSSVLAEKMQMSSGSSCDSTASLIETIANILGKSKTNLLRTKNTNCYNTKTKFERKAARF